MKMKLALFPIRRILQRIAVILSLTCLGGLWGSLHAADRPYFMGTSPFFASTTTFTDFRWENMDDKDMISLHMDDFYGIPWQSFVDQTPPPAAWTDKWTTLAQTARAQGKTIYLSVSPLSGRKTLTDDVDALGNRIKDWVAVDSSGCYVFSGETASTYQQAYIRYCRYVLDLVQPRYFSPVLEISITHGYCPTQREAFDSWYAGVYHELKNENPSRVIFPTLQMEALYGINEPSFACTDGETYDQCFENRLQEELTLPMDRVGISMYPGGWGFLGQTIADHDPFSVVQRLTSKRIWVAETGLPAVPIFLQSSACFEWIPSSVANETLQEDYMSWLLNEAQTRNIEAVNWWLNRDYLDGDSISGPNCPCSGDDPTCTMVAQWASIDLEGLLKIFANMALRRYDGSPRPAWTVWKTAFAQPLVSEEIPPEEPEANEARGYPNPFRPSHGQMGMTLSGFPADTEIVIYTAFGQRVRTFRTDAGGEAIWDAKNDLGDAVASGIYLVHTGGNGNKTIKIVVQR